MMEPQRPDELTLLDATLVCEQTTDEPRTVKVTYTKTYLVEGVDPVSAAIAVLREDIP